jgi:S1-C subfamily serine protease
MSQHRAALGFSFNRNVPGAILIASVDSDSGAADAGLKEGDVLISISGEPFPKNPDRWLRDHQPDERVTIRVQRGGDTLDFSFPLGRQTEAAYQISESGAATEKQRRIRDGILRGMTTH